MLHCERLGHIFHEHVLDRIVQDGGYQVADEFGFPSPVRWSVRGGQSSDYYVSPMSHGRLATVMVAVGPMGGILL
jgi:hypothetical protein